MPGQKRIRIPTVESVQRNTNAIRRAGFGDAFRGVKSKSPYGIGWPIVWAVAAEASTASTNPTGTTRRFTTFTCNPVEWASVSAGVWDATPNTGVTIDVIVPLGDADTVPLGAWMIICPFPVLPEVWQVIAVVCS